MYIPKRDYKVAMLILKPEIKMIQGVVKKIFPDIANVDFDKSLFYGSFKTYGGTESKVNDVVTIIDTAVIGTWYRPDITADCRIYVCEAERVYEVISPPENIEMRNVDMQFKVKGIGGKV